MNELSKIRIAYADDHEIVRNAICDLIDSFDNCLVAVQANNGKELIERLEEINGRVDLCMVDIFMPVMNGYETLVAIRNRWPEMRILVLTGHNTDFYLLKMIMAGANGYLLKNCSPKELQTAITAIYEHGVHHSELMTAKFFRAVIKDEVKLPKFTDKETEFLQLCCSDMSYAQIANKMGVSPKSVDWYRESLFKKLKVASRSGLVIFAIQAGLVPMQFDSPGTLNSPGNKE